MARKLVVAATVAGIAGAAVLAYVAITGAFDPSQKVISDSIEGMETRVVENPASPEHPAFPPARSNLTGLTGNASDAS